MNVVVDKNRLALLQGRLGVPATGDSSNDGNDGNDNHDGGRTQDGKEVSQGEEDAECPGGSSSREVIDICDDAAQGNRMGDEEKACEWPKSLLRYEEHSNHSSASKHLRENGDDGKKDNTPKRQKIEVIDPSPDGNNSRGAVTGMRKLETYFQSNGQSMFSSSKSSSVGKPSAANFGTSTNTALSAVQINTQSQHSSSGTHNSTMSSTQVCSVPCNNSQNTDKVAIAAVTADFKKQIEQLRYAKEQHERRSQRLEAEMRSSSDRIRELEERNEKLRHSLEDVHRNMAFQEARRKRDRLAQDNVRLGKIQTVKTSPTSVGDVWEDGYAWKELQARTSEVSERRDELEKRRNRLKSVKRKYSAKNAGSESNMSDGGFHDTTGGEYSSLESTVDLEIIAEESALRTHMEQLKKEESQLVEAKRLLEAEKAAHQKEFKRCQSEDRSRFFKDLPTLNRRYLLLSMLGRGGFSEVWKALDLVELREVAVKIHQLNPTWSEARKQSYVKHVTREYTIHRDLNHPRVVLLFDVFEIDVNSFATVLELCHGTDLDEKLKTQKTIPEKDAKTILMQIIFGLRYLNGSYTQPLYNTEENGNDKPLSPSAMPPPTIVPRRRSIIHFDLKPANILFDAVGDVKITDFGLSKILDEADEGITSVELTSQGAGTYWYLPPECFDRGDAPPRISSKVDVWSLGVILYQMLYGKRPFGEGKSQERVLSEGIMLNATRVDFPTESTKSGSGSSPQVPKVSEEAKDFIKACLTWDQRHRPDVFQLCQHPYLRPPNKK